jgi:predicted nucleic acid-binding protein
MIYGLFKRVIQTIFEKKKFKIPRKIQTIQDNLDYLEPFTSFFTLIEVIEELRRYVQEKKKMLTNKQIADLIEFFKENFEVEILRSVWVTEKAIQYVLEGIEWEDAIQLEIARVNDYVLVTDDEKLKKIGKKFYDKILDFDELRTELRKIY